MSNEKMINGLRIGEGEEKSDSVLFPLFLTGSEVNHYIRCPGRDSKHILPN